MLSVCFFAEGFAEKDRSRPRLYPKPVSIGYNLAFIDFIAPLEEYVAI
jgi:hypothetical protein